MPKASFPALPHPAPNSHSRKPPPTLPPFPPKPTPRTINSPHVHPRPNRLRRHLLRHNQHSQPPPPLPPPRQRRTLPRNPPALPRRIQIQTPRLRRHARPRPSTPHHQRPNPLRNHEFDQRRLLPPPRLQTPHLATRLHRPPHPQRRPLQHPPSIHPPEPQSPPTWSHPPNSTPTPPPTTHRPNRLKPSERVQTHGTARLQACHKNSRAKGAPALPKASFSVLAFPLPARS